jgi:hypothetical protein
MCDSNLGRETQLGREFTTTGLVPEPQAESLWLCAADKKKCFRERYQNVDWCSLELERKRLVSGLPDLPPFAACH